MRVVHDLNVIKSHWLAGDNLSDDWKYRLAFHQAYGSTPYCIIGEGVFMPLEIREGKTWFFGGGDWNEHMRFLTNVPLAKIMPLIPKPYELIYVDKSLADIEGVSYLEDAYYLDVPIDESMPSQLRKKLREEFNKFKDVKIVQNHFDYDVMVAFNKQRFGDESSFVDHGFYTALQQMVPKCTTISLVREDTIIGCAMGIIHQNVFTFIQGGNANIPNLNKFLNYHFIKYAQRFGVKKVDLLTQSFGWKERWGAKKEPLYCINYSSPDKV